MVEREGDGWWRGRGTDDIVCIMFIFPIIQMRYVQVR